MLSDQKHFHAHCGAPADAGIEGTRHVAHHVAVEAVSVVGDDVCSHSAKQHSEVARWDRRQALCLDCYGPIAHVVHARDNYTFHVAGLAGDYHTHEREQRCNNHNNKARSLLRTSSTGSKGFSHHCCFGRIQQAVRFATRALPWLAD